MPSPPDSGPAGLELVHSGQTVLAFTREASVALSSLQGLTNSVEDYQLGSARIVAIDGEYETVWGRQAYRENEDSCFGNLMDFDFQF